MIFAKIRAGEHVIFGYPIKSIQCRNYTVTVTGDYYVKCTNKNVFERLLVGGALAAPCNCPSCLGGSLAW